MSTTAAPEPEHPVHVSFLLDRSGSMGAIRDDVIGGFNQFLREQKSHPGTCRMTVVQFDSQDPFEVLADGVDVRELRELDADRYCPRGGTPLLDAVGRLIEHAERRARGRNEDAVIVVFTDGEENASRDWSRSALFERIEGLRARGFSFVFLGANQDSYHEAGRLGITSANTSNWNGRDPRTAYAQVSRSLRSYRDKSAPGRALQRADFFEGVKEAEAAAPEEPSSMTEGKGKRRRWFLQ
jgi:hypothetical protein